MHTGGCARKTTFRQNDERELRLFISVGRLLLLLRQGGMRSMPVAAVFSQGPHQNSLPMYFPDDVTTSPARPRSVRILHVVELRPPCLS